MGVHFLAVKATCSPVLYKENSLHEHYALATCPRPPKFLLLPHYLISGGTTATEIGSVKLLEWHVSRDPHVGNLALPYVVFMNDKLNTCQITETNKRIMFTQDNKREFFSDLRPPVEILPFLQLPSTLGNF